MNDTLKAEVKDLLNQIAIKLKDVELPKIQEDEYDDYGYSNLPVRFEDYIEETKVSLDISLSTTKAVVQGLINTMEKGTEGNYSDAAKMARAYYSSFCNG